MIQIKLYKPVNQIEAQPKSATAIPMFLRYYRKYLQMSCHVFNTFLSLANSRFSSLCSFVKSAPLGFFEQIFVFLQNLFARQSIAQNPRD
jgi:hypothetical protein